MPRRVDFRFAVLLLLAAIGALYLVTTLTPLNSAIIATLSGRWTDARGSTLIVLGADGPNMGMLGYSSYWRTVYAVAAWKEGGFDRVLVSGHAVSATMRDFLICQGIPPAAILVEDRSTTTRENAIETTRMLRDIAGAKVLLTGDFHMRRAHAAFERAGLSVIPRPFPEAGKRNQDWRQRWPVFLDLIIELTKITGYKVRGWI